MLKEKYHQFLFTTINRRINRLNFKIKEDDNKSKEFEDDSNYARDL